jgi:phosphomannomutase
MPVLKTAAGRLFPMDKIKFGTDGWRGLIGEDFTFDNVRRIAAAIALYVRKESSARSGLVVGYDTRFLSSEAAQAVAEEIAAAGIPVFLANQATPTPAISYAVVARQTSGAIVITASHNPYRWNGVKFKAAYGGSASPAIMKRVESFLSRVSKTGAHARGAKDAPIEEVDLISPYLEKLKTLVRLDRVRASGLRFVFDPLYGAARGCLARLFDDAQIVYREIHGEHNPLFPGVNPEPIEPHVAGLQRTVLEMGYDAGFATDGDADRIGAIDREGRFVDSHKIFSILLRHLVEDLGLGGEVVKTFSTTRMIDKLAHKHRLRLHVTPIGFKYICDLMLTRDILIGGEESGGIAVKGHLPERDGILNSLLLAQVMAEKSRSLGDLIGDLSQELGPHEYGRVDLEIERDTAHRIVRHVARRKIKSLGGLEVTSIQDLDGAKMIFGETAWLLVRASGTENLLRLYAEAPRQDQVRTLLDEMTEFARKQS